MTTTHQAASPLETSSRGRRLVVPAVSALGAAAFLTLAHVVDPNEPGNYPTCPWLAITGTWCPGCGTLRATHALTHGDLGTAFARNPVTVLAYLLLLRRVRCVHRADVDRPAEETPRPRMGALRTVRGNPRVLGAAQRPGVHLALAGLTPAPTQPVRRA